MLKRTCPRRTVPVGSSVSMLRRRCRRCLFQAEGREVDEAAVLWPEDLAADALRGDLWWLTRDGVLRGWGRVSDHVGRERSVCRCTFATRHVVRGAHSCDISGVVVWVKESR